MGFPYRRFRCRDLYRKANLRISFTSPLLFLPLRWCRIPRILSTPRPERRIILGAPGLPASFSSPTLRPQSAGSPPKPFLRDSLFPRFVCTRKGRFSDPLNRIASAVPPCFAIFSFLWRERFSQRLPSFLRSFGFFWPLFFSAAALPGVPLC